MWKTTRNRTNKRADNGSNNKYRVGRTGLEPRCHGRGADVQTHVPIEPRVGLTQYNTTKHKVTSESWYLS